MIVSLRSTLALFGRTAITNTDSAARLGTSQTMTLLSWREATFAACYLRRVI